MDRRWHFLKGFFEQEGGRITRSFLRRKEGLTYSSYSEGEKDHQIVSQ